MGTDRRGFILAVALLGALTAAALASRPLLPIDETRYVGVAWEMWLRGDFLVPFKNGVAYSHKPPLLMWLINAGWAVFGVNEWWPRLMSPVVSAGNMILTIALARRLWPERPGLGGQACLILVSSFLWSIFSTMAMFDILLAFCTLLGMYGIVLASQDRLRCGMALLGLGIGLGILAKGPVILLHLLPAAILAPWWSTGLKRSRWFGGLFLAVLMGAAIGLAWAIPAGLAGGEEYRHAIFWGQSANRMVDSFAHRRPFWWYLPLLPLLLFPWLAWPSLWRSFGVYVGRQLDLGGRFCLAWMLPVILGFSLISGKQMQYMIPIFPAVALLAARSLADAPRAKGIFLPALLVLAIGISLLTASQTHHLTNELVRSIEAWQAVPFIVLAILMYVWARRHSIPVLQLALLSAAGTILVQGLIVANVYSFYDVHPVAEAIHRVQNDGRQVAYDGTYHDQFQFAGRLQAPLIELETLPELKAWLQAHPDDYVVIFAGKAGDFDQAGAVVAQAYRGKAIALLDTRSALLFLTRSTEHKTDD